MTKLISNYFPVYMNDDREICLDFNISSGLNEIMGSNLVEYMTDQALSNIRTMDIDYIRSLNGNERIHSPGLCGILEAIARTKNGKTPDLTRSDIGMTTIIAMHRSGCMDLVKELVKTNLRPNKFSPGVLAGFCNIRKKCYLGDLFTAFDTVLRVNGYEIDRGLPFQKRGVARSLIADWRRYLFSRTALDKAEAANDGPRHTTDIRTRIMWMLADPYRRLQWFDRLDLKKTVEKIKERFPFALPPHLDLYTRTRDEILHGLKALLFERSEDNTLMDPYAVGFMLHAHQRMMDMGPVSEQELDVEVNERMLELCFYLKDPLPYVKRVDKRLPKGSHVFHFYVPSGSEVEKIRPVIMYLASKGRIMSMDIRNVATYEL